MKDILTRIFNRVEGKEKIVCKLKKDLISLSKTVVSYSTSIKELEIKMEQIFAQLNAKPRVSPTSE